MAPVLFTNTALLIALAALAIPILIHLLLRRKKQRLRFSTIQFLTRQDDRSAHRRKLRNLILLATRLLLLALLVLAFARPYLPIAASPDPPGARRHLVLVLDRSASLHAGDRWAQAIAAARAALGELEGDDRAALIEASARATVLSPLASPARIRSLLNDLTPGFTDSDLGEALREAVKLLPDDVAARSTLHVISDLREAACETIDAVPVPQTFEMRITVVGQPGTPNLAVSGLELDPDGTVRVELRSFSDQPPSRVPVELRVNGTTAATQFVEVPARTTTELSMPLPSLEAGWHTITARIQSGDRFALDDVRYRVLRVPEPIPVLCVEPDPVAVPHEAETYFLLSALNPAAGRTSAGRLSPFHPEQTEPASLARRLTHAPSPRLVFLPALRHFPPELGPALIRFVEQGGGLALFVGESFSPIRYLDELGPLLPVIPGPAEGDRNRPELHWRLGDSDPHTPLLAVFRQPESGDLSLPLFQRRLSLETAPRTEVPARFIDDVPFVVTGAFGEGRVAFLNTTADTTWTDWPKRRTFVPWIHSLAHWLIAGAGDLSPSQLAPRVVGSELEVALGTDAARKGLHIEAPDGTSSQANTDVLGQLRLILEQPGVYRLRLVQGDELRRVAVNLPQAVSNLDALTPDAFQQRLNRVAPASESGWMTGLLDPISDERHFGRLLLMAGAALLLIELFLANRTFA